MKNNINKFAVYLVLFLGITTLSAQQDAQYTQYMYNPLTINPAYAGSRDVLSIVGLYRNQWTGFSDAAPKTATLTLHSPIGNKKLALGFSVINDQIGPQDETYFNIDVSYAIPVSELGKLRFGIKGVGRLFNVDYDAINLADFSDPQFQQGVNEFTPNVGAGLFYTYSDRIYLGLSVPNLLQTKHYDFSDESILTSEAVEDPNFYLTAGCVFNLARNLKLKPALMSKIVRGAPFQLDASANFLIHDKFILGAAYRLDAAMSAMVGFQITPSFLLGMAYDRDTSDIVDYNDGSFEIFARFELIQKYSKVVMPRFF